MTQERDDAEWRLARLEHQLLAVIVRARPPDTDSDGSLRDEVRRRLTALEARVAVLEARRRGK